METSFLSPLNDGKAVLSNDLIDQLTSQGWLVSDHLVPHKICEELLLQLQQHQNSGHLKKAGIGQGSQQKIASEVRGDYIQWIDESTPSPHEIDFLKWLNGLKEQLNSQLYLGLSSQELHYAAYPAGTGYQKHRDVFKGESLRVLSFVLYLNKYWKPGDGGELSIFSEDNPDHLEVKIDPVFSRCVIFLSDKIHHQVEFTNQVRFSVTGWLKKTAPTAVLPVF